MHARILPTAVAAAIAVAALAGCAPDSTTVDETPSPSVSATPTPTPAWPYTPGETRTAPTITMPTDCESIVSASLLSLLQAYPLNDEAFGPTGVQSDGALICIWGSPSSDTTYLRTVISVTPQEEAFTLLNGLADDEGFACYTPDDEGTRCEKSWENEQYPVTDGRTLYWRDDVLIDTQYSNLAPPGYTTDVVQHLFASATSTPAPSPVPIESETPDAG